MNSLVQCDHCGRQVREVEQTSLGVDWLEVERMSNLFTLDQDPGPWNFCGWECLGKHGLRAAKGDHDTGTSEEDPTAVWW